MTKEEHEELFGLIWDLLSENIEFGIAEYYKSKVRVLEAKHRPKDESTELDYLPTWSCY